MTRPRNRIRNPDGSFPSDNPEAKKPNMFKKGQSGNPGGRPKGIQSLRGMIGALSNDGQEIVKFVLGVMRGTEADMNDPRVRFAAAEWLGDRYFGKVKQTVELTPGPEQPQEPTTPPLRDLLLTLDEKDRNDLERILSNFERARSEGRLALPASLPDDDSGETPN